MIISDLNHVEVVSQETETSIVGGYYYFSPYLSAAKGDAVAVAIGGRLTLTKANVATLTAPGFSASAASSASLTAGY